MAEIPKAGSQQTPTPPPLDLNPAPSVTKEPEKPVPAKTGAAATKDIYEKPADEAQRSIAGMSTAQTDFESLKKSRDVQKLGIPTKETVSKEAGAGVTKDIYQKPSDEIQSAIAGMSIAQTDLESLKKSQEIQKQGIPAHELYSAKETASKEAVQPSKTTKAKADQKNIYVIQKGDTISKIAKDHKVTVRDLVLANPGLKDPDKIYPGQQINIRGGATTPKSTSAKSTAAPEKPLHWDLDGTGRVTKGPETPMTVDVTKDPAFQALPRETQQKLLDPKQDPDYLRLSKKAERLQKTIDDPKFQKSSQKQQNELKTRLENMHRELQRLENTPPLGIQKIVNHETYNQLSVEQKTKLLNVYAASDFLGKEELPTLMNRKISKEVGSGIAPEKTPALLSKDNRDGKTLLDHLNTVATQKFHPAAEGRRGLILSRLIQDTAQPSYIISQGQAASCAETAIQGHLATTSPAEYVRLMSGLVGPDRKAVMANGDVLDAAKNDLVVGLKVPYGKKSAIPDDRTVTSRIFQTALVQYARRKVADPETGKTTPVFDPKTSEGGLYSDQGSAVMKALYNKEYTYNIPNPYSTRPGISPAREKVFKDVEKEVAAGNVPVWTVIWNGGKDAHVVLVTQIKDGKVYFRNPWGSEYNRPLVTGQKTRGWGATVVDPQSGLESLPIARFKAVTDGMVARKS